MKGPSLSSYLNTRQALVRTRTPIRSWPDTLPGHEAWGRHAPARREHQASVASQGYVAEACAAYPSPMFRVRPHDACNLVGCGTGSAGRAVEKGDSRTCGDGKENACWAASARRRAGYIHAQGQQGEPGAAAGVDL